MKEPIIYGNRRTVGQPPVEVSPMWRELNEIDLRSVIFYRDLHRLISRYWKPHISAAEFSVLDMIFDRTIGWGKLWEWISLNQFVSGVWNDKKVYSDGTGLGKRTIQRALEQLLHKEMIFRKGTQGHAAQYALNLFWKPPPYQYLNGKTVFRPEGSETYWNTVATGESASIITLIQREGQELYERDILDGTEPETGYPTESSNSLSPIQGDRVP